MKRRRAASPPRRDQDEQRWRLPTDPEPPPDPEIPVLPYALAAGLFATLSGALASLAVPGPAFLIVWAVVALAVAVAAGQKAPKLYAAALRTLIHLADRVPGRRH